MSWLSTVTRDLSQPFSTVMIGSAFIFSAVLTGIPNIHNQPSVLKVSKANKDPRLSFHFTYMFWGKSTSIMWCYVLPEKEATATAAAVTTVEVHLSGSWLSRLVGTSDKFIVNSTKLTWLEITDYWIKYSTVSRLLGLQIRRDQKVQTQVHFVNSNSQIQTANVAHFLRKNPIIQILCVWMAPPN